MPKLLSYTPKKGLVEIDPEKMFGRLHRVKRSRFKNGNQFYDRYTLLRVIDKHLFKDEEMGDVFSVPEWGVAMKQLKNRIIAEMDVVAYKGKMIDREWFK